MMLRNYTAKYIKISKGYMGQLIEWPEWKKMKYSAENCKATRTRNPQSCMAPRLHLTPNFSLGVKEVNCY